MTHFSETREKAKFPAWAKVAVSLLVIIVITGFIFQGYHLPEELRDCTKSEVVCVGYLKDDVTCIVTFKNGETLYAVPLQADALRTLKSVKNTEAVVWYSRRKKDNITWIDKVIPVYKFLKNPGDEDEEKKDGGDKTDTIPPPNALN